MKTLKRRILLAQQEAGVGDELGSPMFLEVVDQSVPDPDGLDLARANQVPQITGYRAGGLFPALVAKAEEVATVDRRPGETLEQLRGRCARMFPRVALWWPVPLGAP